MKGVFFYGIFKYRRNKKINTGHQNEYIEHILKGEGKISLISGAPKSGKSTLALNFAKCIASGTPFWGLKPGNLVCCILVLILKQIQYLRKLTL